MRMLTRRVFMWSNRHILSSTEFLTVYRWFVSCDLVLIKILSDLLNAHVFSNVGYNTAQILMVEYLESKTIAIVFSFFPCHSINQKIPPLSHFQSLTQFKQLWYLNFSGIFFQWFLMKKYSFMCRYKAKWSLKNPCL
jgi:hypothetical protein